jgi:hypothetical protein
MVIPLPARLTAEVPAGAAAVDVGVSLGWGVFVARGALVAEGGWPVSVGVIVAAGSWVAVGEGGIAVEEGGASWVSRAMTVDAAWVEIVPTSRCGLHALLSPTRTITTGSSRITGVFFLIELCV